MNICDLSWEEYNNLHFSVYEIMVVEWVAKIITNGRAYLLPIIFLA